jgi:hypothetical protein
MHVLAIRRMRLSTARLSEGGWGGKLPYDGCEDETRESRQERSMGAFVVLVPATMACWRTIVSSHAGSFHSDFTCSSTEWGELAFIGVGVRTLAAGVSAAVDAGDATVLDIDGVRV